MQDLLLLGAVMAGTIMHGTVVQGTCHYSICIYIMCKYLSIFMCKPERLRTLQLHIEDIDEPSNYKQLR